MTTTALQRFFDGDVWHSFRSSPMAIGAAVVAAVCIFSALFAPWVAPHNPFDLATLELSDARPNTCSAPTTKGATSSRPSCTARASRCSSAWRRLCCR
jgi:ABC-type dipeptide/oligopeptide/nickel transport system permease subunit